MTVIELILVQVHANPHVHFVPTLRSIITGNGTKKKIKNLDQVLHPNALGYWTMNKVMKDT